MKIPNKHEIAINRSADIGFKEFVKLYSKCTAEPYLLLVTNNTLSSDNTLCFLKNLLEVV